MSAALQCVSREDVVREALSWIGTPFHDYAGVKGVGVDCAHFLIRVYATVGLIEDFTPERYVPQWFLHRDEPRFLNTLAGYAHQIKPEDAQSADVVMYNFGRHAAHGAIIVDEHAIVHAFSYAGRVIRSDRRQFSSRVHSYWGVL